MFTTIGSAADYGTFGKWLLLAVTVICWAAQFASLSLTCRWPRLERQSRWTLNARGKLAADRWGLAMSVYMIGFVSYGATLVFYAAVFPRLARNTRYSRDLRERYGHGEISVEVYEREESLEKNRISNISTVGTSYPRSNQYDR